MKKFSFVCISLLCLGTIVSCGKMGTETIKNRIEGKWWYPQKVEFLLDGKVVNSSPLAEYNGITKVYLENGSCTCERELYNPFILTYSIIDNVINVGFLGLSRKLYVQKVSNREGVLDVYSVETPTDLTNEDLAKGEVIATVEGIDIYFYNKPLSSSSYRPTYWHYDKKGNAVQCIRDDKDFYDTERYYFKTE